MTPRSSNSGSVFYVIGSSNLDSSLAYRGNAVRPVAYLKSSVYIIGGDGSKNNPYVLTDEHTLIPTPVFPQP